MKRLRVATYNIHKGVQGLGPLKRLEIHNLGVAIEQLDADIVCLQEVRGHNHKEARRFAAQWPDQPQAQYLCPPGYEAAYRTNAITRHGEHGNALLARWPIHGHRHADMSDHRFEQRGLLHVELEILGQRVHVLVVHLGLIRASRVRQVNQLERYIRTEVPEGAALIVAGDFNEWSDWVVASLHKVGLRCFGPVQALTFPSRLPLVQLDHVFARGLEPTGQWIPRGAVWARMSDHLPLVVEFAWG